MIQKRGKYLPPKKRILFEGFNLTVYSIGWLALMTHRHVQTVRMWEYSGLMPLPIIPRDQIDGVYRYYTAAEIIGYTQIFNQNQMRPGIPKKGGTNPQRRKLHDLMHSFRSQLKAKFFQKDKAVFITNLPNEAKIEEALRTPRNRDIRKEAERILNKK